MAERVRTYQDDLDDIAMYVHAICGSLRRGLAITPGEAACLQQAAEALRDCRMSMIGEEMP